MVTGLPARRDVCDDDKRQATLVEFRGSNLSDAGSIPAISTFFIARFKPGNDRLYTPRGQQHPAACDIRSGMKKSFLLGLLLLTSACNLPVPTPAPDSAPAETPLSTPEAVTDAPGLSITETAVPTPEPPPLYFTEEFDTPFSFWEFRQTGGTQLPASSIQNGTLRIDIASPDTWMVGILNVHSYSDVFVRAKTSAAPAGSVGLICRYSEDGWYEFNVSSDGAYSVLLGQWLSPDVVKYAPIINDLSSKLAGNATSEIGLFCEDNFLKLYANDVMIRRVEVTNYGLTDGKIGITAASFVQAPISAIFEWVQVSQE